MNDRITLGAAVLVAAVLAVRWALTPVRDTTPHPDDHPTVETPLGQLMGDWPEPPAGALVAQAWQWCANCVRRESGLLHAPDCWRCGHCLEVTYAGAEAAS